MARKLSYFEKAGTNWQRSRVISKNLTRIANEAGFFQRTWHELARKPASWKIKPKCFNSY